VTNRRDFLIGSSALAQLPAAAAQPPAITVNPTPLFDISPYLFMQFMEPLGVTDSSVEAAWDYDADAWRRDFVAATQQLAPQVIRWGGLYSRYYKWREGVGTAAQRPWMRNYVWGGKETNRVGTGEFCGLCKTVGAQPLMCVNFLSDGEQRFLHTKEGDRSGDAREAADWVSYANDPSNAERIRDGARQPYGIRLWQLGNETSYGNATFNKSQAIAHTIEFAKAMKERDPSIQLIGWGDRGSEGYWATDMVEQAGEWLSYIAIHMMGQSPKRKDTVLNGLAYQTNPMQAWEELIELSNNVESRLREAEAAAGPRMGIAVTEGHLSLRPSNTNPILLEWLSAVYHARSMNIYQRHGARVKIATAADFQGNRWTVNALLLQVPRGITYPTPAGSVTQLFRRHIGKQGAAARSASSDLDVAASVDSDRCFLHVVNLNARNTLESEIQVAGRRIVSGRVFEIAPADLRQRVTQDQPAVFSPSERELPLSPRPAWRFPAGSVSAIELETETLPA
jgi:alpha-L-arabinofuranosidase